MKQPDLFGYGVQNEESDIRAHVCVLAERVYVFPTWAGVKAIKSGLWPEVPAYQTGVDFATAKGFLIRPEGIERCTFVLVPALIREINFSPTDSTSIKGEKAAGVVETMLRRGWFPLPADPDTITDLTLQRSGVDIMVVGNWRIQVKCDYRGGCGKDIGCTGNLFLQTQELNPRQAY